MGSFILALIPDQFKPRIVLRRSVQILATVGIAFFSFIPIYLLATQLNKANDMSGTLSMILSTFEIGKAWIFTFIIANILFIFLLWIEAHNSRLYALGGLILTLIMILGLGWASHASSIESIKGFVTHTGHFAAVTIWIGILLVVSWFSKDYANWLRFLKWFTPVAAISFAVTVISGILLMTFVVEVAEYTNSWMLSYGQALLIKHLLIIPLILFAAINSLLIKKMLQQDIFFNPRPWAKIETFVVLLVFSVTAALGHQSPPSDSTFKSEGPSKLFTYFYQGQNVQVMDVELSFHTTGLALLLLSILLIGLALYAFIKKAPAIFSFLLSVLFVFSSYLTLIWSIN